MGGNRPEEDTDEFLQTRLENAIRDAAELHGWSMAISVANPVDILMLLEAEAHDDEKLYKETRHDRSNSTTPHPDDSPQRQHHRTHGDGSRIVSLDQARKAQG